MTKSRDDILARIRALRAKASDSAASEAEAQAAAAAAAKLLMRYDLDEAELNETPEDVTLTPAFDVHPVQKFTSRAISRLTETRCWFDNKRLRFAGLPHDVEMAMYLTEMLRGAAERGWMQAYMDQPLRAGKRLDMATFREGFYAGFSERLSERMNELAEERAKARPTGTDIVLSKHGLIAAQLEKEGIRLKQVNLGSLHGSQSGRAAGHSAGDRVGLGRPIAADASGIRALGR